MSLYESAKALVNVLSENENDYPDASTYRMIMDKCKVVLSDLNKVEKTEQAFKAKQNLEKERREIIEEEWQNAYLIDTDEDLIIDCDGWDYDGKNHFSRKYYVQSLTFADNPSEIHTFSVEFKDNSIVIDHIA